MKICLVRHGETDWNREMKFQGWADISLNERGREEARALAKKLEGIAFDEAYCSDLDRAAETAEIILGDAKTELHVDPRLREMGFGPLEGQDYSNAKNDPESPVHLLFTHPDEYIPEFGGERLSYVSARFDAFRASVLDPLEAKGEARTVLIVAHGIIVRDILTRAGGFPYEDFWKLPVGNCSAAFLELKDGSLSILEMGEKVSEWLI